MIKINLLPHREAKRKQLKNNFYTLLLLSGMIAVIIIIAVGTFFSMRISQQSDRNNFIKAENAKLDEKIKEVASLKQEIDGLKARQQAVEDLQGDRNQPVFMLDELVKLTPEGVFLKGLKQDGQRIVLNGYAQSNQRVSEFLRNLGNKSAWMIKPDLIEIKSTGLGQGRDAKKVFDFTINVGIKRPREKDSAAASGAVDINPDSKKP
ncbi:PilN domain-containing protein [Undibacterium sp. Jales W-56]|uniref:PilN domain-containing protein n=1 Tax=Undibacterium sp. Jales W-56 TaxID=2897325 RepID=UPI0021D2992A|nr:PilN domain-containing protein [Undibacterium sp. Jales W-56]MCU6432203.1 PilN domain-containing protein [Undibacterium sp. Jales W-56]